MRNKIIPLCAITFALIWATPAYAYMDPSTTGVIMQIVAPILVVVSMGWSRLKQAMLWLASRVKALFNFDHGN